MHCVWSAEAAVMAGQPGFFDVDERYAALSAAGEPLERLSAVVDFEIFRPALNAVLVRSDRSRGGRPPDAGVLMFRILVLQALDSLSDEQTEFPLRDRLGVGAASRRAPGRVASLQPSRDGFRHALQAPWRPPPPHSEGPLPRPELASR
jgi:hypothetical protein